MEKTTLAIDGHVHLYSVFDFKTAVESGRSNLLSNKKDVLYISNILSVYLFNVILADPPLKSEYLTFKVTVLPL